MIQKLQWTDEDIQLLTEIYQQHGHKAGRIAHEQMPHRTLKSIQNRAYQKGITRRREVIVRDVKNESRLEDWWKGYCQSSLADIYDQVDQDYKTLKGIRDNW